MEQQEIDPVTTSAPQNAMVGPNIAAVVPKTAAIVPDRVEVSSAQPLKPVTTSAVQTATTVTPLRPLATTVAEPIQASETPKETVTGDDASITAPLRSLRPNNRPAGLAPPPPPRQAQTQTTQRQTTQPRGNSTQNARQGAQTQAPRDSGAAQSGSNANTQERASAASNAAVMNYNGQVMRRIARQQRRVRTNARGAATVRFSITGGGGIGSVSIQRSSGNADLDAAAIRVVQNAAPFPAPPRGAQTSFRVEIRGR